VGKIPVLRSCDSNYRQSGDPEQVGEMKDDHTHWDEPSFMLPRTGKEQHQEHKLEYGLHPRAAFIDPDEPTILEIDDPVIAGSYRDAKDIVNDPDALMKNHSGSFIMDRVHQR